jgi:hypothetical protein
VILGVLNYTVRNNFLKIKFILYQVHDVVVRVVFLQHLDGDGPDAGHARDAVRPRGNDPAELALAEDVADLELGSIL